MTTFALNHMAAPRLGAVALLDLARDLGCVGVEFRNDLDSPLFDGLTPESIAREARARRLRVLALAEIKAFNDPEADAVAQAKTLIPLASGCGAEGISLIPRNDGRAMDPATRDNDLARVLEHLAPLLEAANLLGFVEPLGFPTCSLRQKEDAVTTLSRLGLGERFRLVHDTFHHALAGRAALFPEITGIVHVSGVTDPGPEIEALLDRHRVLVSPGDRLGNLEQVAALRAGGYDGPLSFEPFAEDIHRLDSPSGALQASMDLISGEVAQAA